MAIGSLIKRDASASSVEPWQSAAQGSEASSDVFDNRAARQGAKQGSDDSPAHDDGGLDEAEWGTAKQRLAAVRALRHIEETSLPQPVQSLMTELPSGRAAAHAVLTALQQKLQAFIRRPLLAETVASQVRAPALFAAWKAIDLIRYGLTGHEVVEGYARVSGHLGGAALAQHNVFWQHVAAPAQGYHLVNTSARAAQVLLLVPDIGETGRIFGPQVGAFAQQGHEIYTADAPWAGYTQTADPAWVPGQLDHLAAVARNIVRLAESIQRQFKGGQRLVLVGRGAGGAAILRGVLAVLQGELESNLDLSQVDVILQAPLLAVVPSVKTAALAWLGKQPRAAAWSAWRWLPNPQDDAMAAAHRQECRLREAVPLRTDTFANCCADLPALWQALREAKNFPGGIAAVHALNHPLADPAATMRLAQAAYFGRRMQLRLVGGAGDVWHEVQASLQNLAAPAHAA